MIVDSGGTSPVLLLGAIVGLVGLAVLVFVLLLGGLRGRDDKKKAPKPGRRQQAATPEAPPDDEPADTPRQGEMMRVLRNPDTGRVMIEVEGRCYEHIREIEDAQVGRRILWAIADLIRFTGGVATNPQAVRSASAAVDWEEGTPAPVPGAGRAWSPPSATSPAAMPSAGDADTSPTANLSKTMRAFFQRGFSPAPSDPAASAPGSFVEQIEALLQKRLQALDPPLPHEVHIQSGPQQRLQIQVGREVYGSVDEVANPQVRALIQAAVAEWEQR
jgi:hypothetical protein